MFNSTERLEFLKSFAEKNQFNSERQGSNYKSTHSIKRWEYLYQLDKVKTEKAKEKQNLRNSQIIEEETKTCTFSPSIRNKNILEKGYIRNTQQGVVERNLAWNNRRLSKIQQKVTEKKAHELDDIVPFTRSKGHNASKSTQKIDLQKTKKNSLEQQPKLENVNNPRSYNCFLNRTIVNRQKKEEEQRINSSRPGSGLKYTGKKTKVQEFNLRTSVNRSERNKEVIHSLRRVSSKLI